MWQDYTFEVTFRSTDDDGMGALFYYTDENNYYKVDFSAQDNFSKLFLVMGGVETTLALVPDFGFNLGVDTHLEITVAGGEITILRDGANVFGTIQDTSLSSGSVALYNWVNDGSFYDDITVTSTGATPEPTALFVESLDAMNAEGNTGTTEFTFIVARDGDTSFASSVTYTVIGSGANPADATDFAGAVFPAGTVVFAVGETSKLITLEIAGDTDVEANETFEVTLSNPTNGGQIVGTPAAAAIQDDDSPPSPTLLSDNFDDGDFNGWTVDDQGIPANVSAWSVINQEAAQTANAVGTNTGFFDNRLGTVLYWDDPAALTWQDYTFEATFRSDDDDGMGFVFYYTDENNYYKVDFATQFNFSKLFLVQGGVETTLASVTGPGFMVGANTDIEITVSSGNIRVLRDGVDVFGTVADSTLTNGTVGLYNWVNLGSFYDDVRVTGTGAGVLSAGLTVTSSGAITGTAGDDALSGGDGDDVIDGARRRRPAAGAQWRRHPARRRR